MTTAAAEGSPFECPICGLPLRTCGGSLACRAGHSFDVAREGYVNLLPPQHRHRGITGDVPEMLAARRRFLEAGHYEPLLDLLAQTVGGLLESPAAVGQAAEPYRVLDAGCGEGYYVGGLARRLSERGIEAEFVGMDVSKAAVKMAARRHPGVGFFVGDVNRRVYLPDQSVNVVLNMFAPRNPNEFARVCRRQGRLVAVLPGEDHLRSLREALGLLEVEEDKERKVLERFSGTFDLHDRTELSYGIPLSSSEIADLVMMGPNRWHPPRAAFDGPMVAEASFIVLTLGPNW